ncbi:flagellar assembly protein FliH [Quatrionicoccus australiensis]|uniref:flagellar assembly protein FliH n=1 Tax=Quatrionicoccus australiensis TaxID=138118 RepID=UPI001CF86CF5|nr:flagellar assembly protein FliH [Quatrionicoccus australiensis]UCV15971.1 flagellar assembly protein FliH [Quatrionicoccus australiensis]
MSEIIPKEKLGGFQRWQVNSFDPPKPVIAQAPPPPPPQVEESSEEVDQAFHLPTAEELERLHEETRAAGYQAGYEEGRLAAEESSRAAAEAEIENLRTLADGFQRALDELDQSVAEHLLALATEIASQMISGTIAVKDDVLLPIIRQAIAALPLQHNHLTLRLNPADAARVRAQLGEQFQQSGTQIIDDSEISPGGCLVRAGTSEVDATVETRWKRVLEAIGSEPTAWLNP